MYRRHGLISSLSAICLVVIMVSCGNKGQVSSSGSIDSLSVDSVATEVTEEVCLDSIKTDTVSFSKEDGIYKFGLVADYPVAGPDSVVKKIREFINDFFGGAYEGSLADGNGMIAKNGEMSYARSKGFKGTFLIEPKPMEPSKHQYDVDTETVIGFLRAHGLDKDFEDGKLTLEQVYEYGKKVEEPKQTSGKQEKYETIVALHCK